MGCSQSTLVTEPEPPIFVTDEKSVVAPIEVEVAEEIATEDVVVSEPAPETEVPAKAFVIMEEIVEINGVVHYTVQSSDGQQVQKRYSEFKQLHDTLCKTEGCKGMPQAGVWTALQRTNEALVADRRAKFEALLNEWASKDVNNDVLIAFMTAAA